MPWRGPSRSSGLGPAGDYALGRERDNDEFERSLRQAEFAQAGGREFAASIARIDAERRSSDEGRARLATTPGVTRGGSTTTRSVADSPLMRSSATNFEAFGDRWSFDPILAGELEGAAQGAGQNAADELRYKKLMTIPGVTQKDAARIVYGRTGVLDQPDPNDPRDMHAALARYLREPTRENAARAVSVGAQLNQFPDRFGRVQRDPWGGELPERPEPPVPGTPEYDAFQQRQIDMRGREQQEQIRLRASESAARDPGAVDRREAQQARLDLDEARRDIPHPSKVPQRISQRDPSGKVSVIDNPAFAAATADSLNFERRTLEPLRKTFREAISGPEGGRPAAPGRSSGASTPPPPPAAPAKTPAPAPGDDMQAQADDTIRQINASRLPTAEKAKRITEIKRRLAAAQRGG